MKNSKGLNAIRWIIAAFMWMMALGALTFGGAGILGAILFAAFGFIVSPLSSKFLFPLFPNLKKSHKILGATGIWLAANVFMGIAVPPATETDLINDVATVAESTTEIAERSMPSSDSLEETESTTLTASAEKEIETQKTAEEEAEESKKAAEEAEAKKAAEEAAVQKEAEEAAAQKETEEAVQQTTTNQSSYTTTANGTENANALAVINMGPTTGSPCWVPRNGGTKYHTKSSCSGMNDPIYTTVDTATACGFDACKRCH